MRNLPAVCNVDIAKSIDAAIGVLPARDCPSVELPDLLQLNGPQAGLVGRFLMVVGMGW